MSNQHFFTGKVLIVQDEKLIQSDPERLHVNIQEGERQANMLAYNYHYIQLCESNLDGSNFFFGDINTFV